MKKRIAILCMLCIVMLSTIGCYTDNNNTFKTPVYTLHILNDNGDTIRTYENIKNITYKKTSVSFTYESKEYKYTNMNIELIKTYE